MKGRMTIFKQYEEIIPDYRAFEKGLQEPFPTHLRVNLLKTDTDTLVRRLTRTGIILARSCSIDASLYQAANLSSSGNLPEYFGGHIHPQALTSCLASVALSPSKGSCVLDMCASPGGKTSHMAQLMNNTGAVVANELYPSRQNRLGHTLSRLGVLNCMVTGYQAQEFPLRYAFDFVLADVPCSGEGRFRKLKEFAAYDERKTKEALPDLQKKILRRGFDLLKDDGILLYSTCTYNPLENEAVVNDLLQNRNATLLPIDTGVNHEPGITQWRNEQYESQLSRCARFYPHRINSVGFFMARIGRRK